LPSPFTYVYEIVSFFLGFLLAALLPEAWSRSIAFIVLSDGLFILLDVYAYASSLGFVPFFCGARTFNCAGQSYTIQLTSSHVVQ
jgi:hypothetical protein